MLQNKYRCFLERVDIKTKINLVLNKTSLLEKLLSLHNSSHVCVTFFDLFSYTTFNFLNSNNKTFCCHFYIFKILMKSS